MIAVSTVAKKRHRIIFRHREEVYVAIRAGEIIVEADAKAKDDFAHDPAL